MERGFFLCVCVFFVHEWDVGPLSDEQQGGGGGGGGRIHSTGFRCRHRQQLPLMCWLRPSLTNLIKKLAVFHFLREESQISSLLFPPHYPHLLLPSLPGMFTQRLRGGKLGSAVDLDHAATVPRVQRMCLSICWSCDARFLTKAAQRTRLSEDTRPKLRTSSLICPQLTNADVVTVSRENKCVICKGTDHFHNSTLDP